MRKLPHWLSMAAVAIAALTTFCPAMSQPIEKKTLQKAESWVILGKAGKRLHGSLGTSLDRSQLKAIVGEPTKAGTHEAEVFNTITSSLAGQSPVNQLALVNRFYNRQPYKTDDEAYGVLDHWATVGEFLDNGGDCEDYAIAKFRTLLRAGFPESRLRIVLVDDSITHAAHAVLAARVGNTTYILDNQAAWLRPESSLTYYHPLYSLNGSGIWYHGESGPHLPVRDMTVTNR